MVPFSYLTLVGLILQNDELLQIFNCEVWMFSPYSLDLIPGDFFLFLKLKVHSYGTIFSLCNHMESAAKKCLIQQGISTKLCLRREYPFRVIPTYISWTGRKFISMCVYVCVYFLLYSLLFFSKYFYYFCNSILDSSS